MSPDIQDDCNICSSVTAKIARLEEDRRTHEKAIVGMKENIAQCLLEIREMKADLRAALNEMTNMVHGSKETTQRLDVIEKRISSMETETFREIEELIDKKVRFVLWIIAGGLTMAVPAISLILKLTGKL